MTGRGLGGVAALAFALIAGRTVAGDDMPRPAEGPDPGSEAEQVQSGKALYAEHCSHCHGFGMVNAGNVVPDLREFPTDNKQRFVDTVAHGKNNRMPPWGDVLSSAEIEAMWAYVRTGGK
jgi:mono/diheme cytochrome c family protein